MPLWQLHKGPKGYLAGQVQRIQGCIKELKKLRRRSIRIATMAGGRTIKNVLRNQRSLAKNIRMYCTKELRILRRRGTKGYKDVLRK